MKACLLFGNGINRCFGGISWDELLTNIASRYFVSTEKSISESITYERIANAVFERMRMKNMDNFAINSHA